MHKYELALIISTKIEDEEKDAVLAKVQDIIVKAGGAITNVDDWGKKKLAYEIQKMPEGYYYFIAFEGEGNCPNEVEDRVRIVDNVIRYLVVRQDA